MVRLTSFLATALVAGSTLSPVVAHPEEYQTPQQIAEASQRRLQHAADIQRGLASCHTHPDFNVRRSRDITRRHEKATRLRNERDIDEDDHHRGPRRPSPDQLAALKAFEEINHNMTSKGYDKSTDAKTLFASYKNVTGILTPELDLGPYWVTGECLRSNLTENEKGIPVHLEYQFIDVSTCSPIKGLYVESWQANATGVYSGTASEGGLNTTYLRGVQKTDKDGVAAFDTIVPGHYHGRASHIHLIAEQRGVEFKNGTYKETGSVSHVGQIFFQEELKQLVESTPPYTLNTFPYTSNEEDGDAARGTGNEYDPFPEFAYLGDRLEDGLLMWISVGINMSAEYNITNAATWTKHGGVPNPDFKGPGGGSPGHGLPDRGPPRRHEPGHGGPEHDGPGHKDPANEPSDGRPGHDDPNHRKPGRGSRGRGKGNKDKPKNSKPKHRGPDHDCTDHGPCHDCKEGHGGWKDRKADQGGPRRGAPHQDHRDHEGPRRSPEHNDPAHSRQDSEGKGTHHNGPNDSDRKLGRPSLSNGSPDHLIEEGMATAFEEAASDSMRKQGDE